MDTPVAADAVDTSNISEETADETVETDEVPAEEVVQAEAVKEAVKSNKRKYSPKVSGKQVDIELDWENEEEVNKYLSKALAADQKWQEAAQLRKNVENLVNELKTNPRAVLMHPELGLDIKKLATDILNEEIEDSLKTPEQKELEKLRKELDSKNKREKELEEQSRQAEMSRLEEQAFKKFDDDLTAALSKGSLPKSPYVVKRVADLLIQAVELGYTDATVDDVMPIAEQQISEEIQKLFEAAPEDVVEKLIGKKKLDSMRKSRLAKMKAGPATAKQIKETGKTGEKEASDASGKKKEKFSDIFGAF